MQNFTIKNFRVYDENGATFDLAPITLLTGCNSSGKSSFTKSWILFQEFFQQLTADIVKDKFESFSDYYINFTHGSHKLGSFESVVNWSSSSNKITIEYDALVYSIGRTMHVTIVFAPGQTIVQKRNVSDLISQNKLIHKSTSKDSKSLFAYVESLVISHPQLGVLYEYNNNGEKRVSHFRLNHEYLLLLVAMTGELDFKNATDEMINCRNAEDAGYYSYSSNYCSSDIEDLINFYGDKDINLLYNRWEIFRETVPEFYNRLIKKHGFKLQRDSSRKIDWKATQHSHNFEDYKLFYPMTFIKDLDAISKENTMSWVNEHIIEKSKGEWYDCDKFRDRIYYIFNRYIQSEHTKFSDFWSHYELAYMQAYQTDFGVHEPLSMYGGEFTGTASEVAPWNENIYEKDWNWDNISDAKFFDEMFLCLCGFGGYYDVSVMGGPSIKYNERDILLMCAEAVCLEALVSSTDLCNAQFVEINRSNAQRIYTFGNQGTTFNDTLEKYIEKEEKIPFLYGEKKGLIITEKNKYKKGTFLKKWLKKLVDYDDVIFDLAIEGVGVCVYLKKKINGKMRLISLADVGYGTTPLISMLIRIELMICQQIQEQTRGVLFIEEPESNLHPNLQAQLSEMFADATKHYPVKFVLETHSEYIVRKLQSLVASKKISSDDVALYYLSNPDAKKRAEGEPQIKRIKIKETGGLDGRFGTGFLDEATILSTELFKKQ